MKNNLLLICAIYFTCLTCMAMEPPPRDGKNEISHPKHDGKPIIQPRGPRAFYDWGRGNDVIIYMKKLKKENPERYEELNSLRNNDMEAFLKAISAELPKPQNTMRKMIQLENECRNLALKIRGCKNQEERAQLEELLKAKLKESYDSMLKDSEERLERLRNQIEFIKEEENNIIEKRFKDFLDPNYNLQPFKSQMRDGKNENGFKNKNKWKK